MYNILSFIIIIILLALFVLDVNAEKSEKSSDPFMIALKWNYYISFALAVLAAFSWGGNPVKTFSLAFLFAFLSFLFMIVLFVPTSIGGEGNSIGGYSYKPVMDNNKQESIDYVPQRLGGSGWLSIGNAFSNLNSAIASVESSKKFHPNNRFRVAERRNGRIVGTAYSC